MKNLLYILVFCCSVESFAGECNFTTENYTKNHQSFIGLIDDSDDYIPAKVAVTKFTLSDSTGFVTSKTIKVKSLDNTISTRRTARWESDCAAAVSDLKESAVEIGCSKDLISKIADIKCQF